MCSTSALTDLDGGRLHRDRSFGICPGRSGDGPPGAPVFQHDAYVAGMGILRPTIFGLVPLGAIKGTVNNTRGKLMRWLAKAVRYPTALLPGNGLEWSGRRWTRPPNLPR